MRKSLLLVLLFGIILNSCYSWGGVQGLNIVNNSDMKVSFYPYTFLPISVLYGEFYPDTILMLDTLMDRSLIHISPHSSATWETPYNYRDIKKGIIPYANDTMMFFLFSTDTLRKYSWTEIKRGYMILKRYDITGRELDDQDWTITYP